MPEYGHIYKVSPHNFISKVRNVLEVIIIIIITIIDDNNNNNKIDNNNNNNKWTNFLWEMGQTKPLNSKIEAIEW